MGRVVLLALGAIGALAAVILLAVNLYVQSQGIHARIQQELSQRLGTTLRLRRISVTPWGGLKLSGITIPQESGAARDEFLQAKTFRLRIDFPSLFSQRLVIKEISLVEPKVIWAQNANGSWRLPPPTREPAPPKVATAAQSPPTTEPPAASAATAQREQSADRNQAAASTENDFIPEIRRVNLIDGAFRFLDQRGNVIAVFDGVQFHSNFRNAADVHGNISVAKTSLRDRFFLHELQSHLRYGPDAVDLSDVAAKAGGGIITGRFNVQPQLADSPFTANVKFHDVQADRVVTEAGGPAGTISGKLEGFLDAAGKTSDPNALAGSGEIVLRDGQLRQYSLLDALGQILQIEELRQLRLDQAHVKYHISPGVVTVDELLFRSPNIRLSAVGTVSFDGKLRLNSQLAINDQIRRQLFRAIRDNFQPLDEPGFAGVSFAIGGTVEHPKSDLMDKVVGRELKDLGSVINALFGEKSDRSKRHKNAEAPTDEAPAETASPAAVESPQPSPGT